MIITSTSANSAGHVTSHAPDNRLPARCRLCGHGCGADRRYGPAGRCGMGGEILLAASLPHFGEEPPISGTRGSGTIFFSGCALTCVFCQNHQISQGARGQAVTAAQLAGIMLELQKQGVHNINLVSPTPWIPGIKAALIQARVGGLILPVVYNTGGFDHPAALRELRGLVDVYLPDVKYARAEAAARYSGARNYVPMNRLAVAEMYRQVGPLATDTDGLAVKGVLIRHLVLPGNLAGTDLVLERLARDYGPEVWISLMAQYRPAYRTGLGAAEEFPELDQPLTEDEYDRAIDLAWDLGLENVFIQEMDARETYVPDFDRPEVFGGTT